MLETIEYAQIAIRHSGKTSLKNPDCCRCLSPPLLISPSLSFFLSPSDKEAWGFCILRCLICTEGRSCLFSSMQHLRFKILLTTFCCSWAAGYLSPLSEQTRKEQCRRYAGRGTCSSFHPTNKQKGREGDKSSQPFSLSELVNTTLWDFYEAICTNEG